MKFVPCAWRHRAVHCSACAFLVVCVTVAAAAQALPAQLTVRGHSLVLNGEAVRSELFGMIELYRIGLYLPERTSLPERIKSDTPKTLVLHVMHDTRSEYLPEDWRDELRAVLTPNELRKLRSAYAQVRAGDFITISYVPGQGSRLTVNDDVVLESKGREMMYAFLQQWLGQRPVSENIKTALLGGGR